MPTPFAASAQHVHPVTSLQGQLGRQSPQDALKHKQVLAAKTMLGLLQIE